MAKKFACVSFGILCLVAAYQLGAERASADWNSTVVGQHRTTSAATTNTSIAILTICLSMRFISCSTLGSPRE